MSWIVFFLYFTFVNCNSINSNEHKLIHTQIIFRHGDTFNPNANSKSSQSEGLGQLTNEGKRQAYRLGQFLHRRYGKFIGPYSPSKVSVFSADNDRTINTASLALSGFFPPTQNQVWNEDLLWQPIAVHTIPLDKDVYIANKFACPRYVEAGDEYAKSPEMIELKKKNHHLYAYLNELHSDIQIGRPSEKEKVILMKTLTGTPELKRLKSGFLLKQILDHFLNKTLSHLPDELMRLYSAHSITIAAILDTLGLLKVHDPPHTSSLMFELYESKEGHYIQLFYRNTNAKHLVPLSIPNCGTKCSLRKYYELYGEFLASDPEKECVAHANHAESGGRMIESSFVFSIFNIVLIYTWIYH